MQAAFASTSSKPSETLPRPTVFIPSPHGGPVECDDAYYHYLPGLVNFCMGVHDWESGRYQNGIGFLKLAAGWGSKGAQYTLGLAYYRGNHVAADPALGIAWLKLANERHDNKQIEVVTRSAVKHATPAQRQRAQQLFQKMRKRYGDKVAATRAWKQFEHYHELVAYERGGTLGGSGSNGCVFLTRAQAQGAGYQMPGQSSLSPTGGVGTRSPAPRPGTNPDAQHKTNPGGVCVAFTVFDAGARYLSRTYFHGWEGHVTVEPLQQIPTPPAHQH